MQAEFEFAETSDEAAEYQTRENKKSLSEEKAGIETVAAFATAQGGILRFGVSPGGERVGAQIGANTLENLANNIKRYTEPPQFPTIRVEGPDENCVVIVKVEESPIKPVFAYNVPLKRVGRTNLKLSREECHRLMSRTRRHSWDALECRDLKLSELDNERIEAFTRRAEISRSISSRALLDAMGLLLHDTPVHAAALLFSSTPQKWVPSAYVQCARFEGRSSVRFLDSQTFEGDVITQIENALAFVRRNTKQKIRITGAASHDRISEYPEEAVREAINNAVCHRDYAAVGRVQVRIYNDRLEVWNPGSLPPGLSVADLYREHSSHPRNPLLADALHRARVIEHWGTGTLRIVEACDDAGMPHPQFVAEQGTFKVRFLGLSQQLFGEITGLEDRPRRAMAHILEHGRITTGEYARLNEFSERTARNDLNTLVAAGLLQRVVNGPRTFYSLAEIEEASH